MKSLIRFFKQREAIVVLFLALVVGIVGFLNPVFVKPETLLRIALSSLILVILGVGESFAVITRGIDVSVGAVMGFSAVCLGLAANAGVPTPAAALIAVAAGAAAGALSGAGIALFGIPPIIMTLGTMGVLRGLMPIMTGGSWIDAVPQSVKDLAGAHFLGVPSIAWFTLLLVAAATAVLALFRPARYFYAVGDSEEAAFLLGIPVRGTKFAAYLLSGIFAGIASVLFVSQLSFVPMQAGSGQEMRAVAASVLGGVSLAGGVGSPAAPLVGALFLTTIDSVLVFLKLPAYWNDAAAGAILLSVVLFDYGVRKLVDTENKKRRVSGRNSGGRAAAGGAKCE